MDMYADDTGSTAVGETIETVEKQLQQYTDNTDNWCNENMMVPHPKKTKVMIVTTSKRASLLPHKELNVQMKGIQLENVSSEKSLGVIIDSNLNWKEQVQKLYTSVNRSLALLRRIKRFLPQKTRILFYNGYILSIMQYCITVWGSSTDIEKIYKLQKRAARIILDVTDIRTPSKEMFQKLDWLPLRQMIDYRKAIIVYKSLNGMAPNYIRDMFRYVHDIHTSTRKAQTNKLFINNKTKLKCHRDTLCYKGAEIWNQLPDAARSATSIRQFKHACYDHFKLN
jgi:hypothetical protein